MKGHLLPDTVTLVCVLLLSIGTAHAEIPRLIPHQGRIAVNDTNVDGPGQFKFLLYKHTDSDEIHPSLANVALWSNSSPAPADLSEPPTAVSLPVTKGLYATFLGDPSHPNMAALPANLVPDLPYDQVLLRIWFSTGSGFEQLSPDQALGSAPFALHAESAEGAKSVADGSIGTAALAPSAVTATKIQPGAVSQLGTPNGAIPDALKMDNLGHAGLGTANPQAALHVAGGSDVTAPVVLSILQGSATPDGVATNGRGLLAVAGPARGRVTFYDITDPSAPRGVVSLQDGVTTNGHLYDSIPFVSQLSFDPTGNLLAISASDPNSSFVNRITLVSVEGAATPNPTFQSVLEDDTGDFQDLDQIQAMAFSDAQQALLAVASVGNTSTGSVSIIDVSEPSGPRLLTVLRDEEDGFDKLAGARDVAFRGALLAVAASQDKAVTLVDLSAPESPQPEAVLEQHQEFAGHTYNALSAPIDVEIRGNLLAIAALATGAVGDHGGLTLVDVSVPSDAQLVATLLGGQGGLDLVSRLWSVAFCGNDLLAAASHGGFSVYGNSVTLFDVSDPATPVIREVMRDGQGELGSLQWPSVVCGGSLLIISSPIEETVTLVDPAATIPDAAGLVIEERVGIGTTRPEATLHVNGDVRIDNASLFSLETPRLAMGIGNAVRGDEGFAIGRWNTAGFGSTAIGYNTTATGGSATALGSSSVATGYGSTAIGISSEASGEFSMVLGDSSQALGRRSFAIGSGSWAEGENSTAIGDNARALKDNSTALGSYATASGFGALALGASTEASGNGSTAIGQGTLASGTLATAMGSRTVAPSYAETALGTYNTEPSTVHDQFGWDPRDRLLVVGNGNFQQRSDLLTIFKDGRLQHAGSIAAVGDVTTLSNFRYVFPRVRLYQVPAAAFTPDSDQTQYRRGPGYLTYPPGGGTTSGSFTAPVHLPDGAQVTRLIAYYYDNVENPGGTGNTVYINNIQAELLRIGTVASEVSESLMASTPVVGTLNLPNSNAKKLVEDTTILLPTIDNDGYHYWVTVYFGVNTPAANLRFYGATIDYTQDIVAP